MFVAVGEGDENVPVEASIQRLRETKLDHFTIKIYPDGGHGIVDTKTNKLQEQYLDDLVDFIENVKQ